MKAKWFWILLFVATAVQSFFSLAFAFTAPGVPSDDQAGEVAQQVWNLIVNKNYALAIGPGLALVVWALRKYDTKIPKVGPAIDKFLNQPFVAFLTPTVISAAAGAGTAIAAHKPYLDVLGAVFQASMSAVFAYVGLKKLGEQKDAGAAEAAKVTDKASAIEELKKQ